MNTKNKKNNYDVKLEIWDKKDGKGIDDVLAKKKPIRLVAGDEVIPSVEEIVKQAEKAELSNPKQSNKPQTKNKKNGVEADARPYESLIAPELQAKYKNILNWDATAKAWRKYIKESGVWEIVQEEFIQHLIEKDLDLMLIENFKWRKGFTFNYLNGILKFLRGGLAIKVFEDIAGFLPLKNGVLDLHTMKLSPHAPENKISSVIPYDYDSTATAEPIIKWLHTTVGDWRIVQILRAYLKAILIGAYYLHKVLEIVGPGGSGKSTFIRLAIALVGKINSCVTELRQLETNRFETSKLYGKKLTTITDSERYGGEVATLKALTGGDQVRYEKKFENQTNGFTYGGMIIIAANEPISSSDYTSGLQRRRLSIHFNNRIPNEQQRDLINIDNEQISGEFAEHIPGLLNWVLSMPDDEMVALLKHTDSTPGLLAMKYQTLIESNSLAEWVNDCVIYDQSAQTKVGMKIKITAPTYFNSNSGYLFENVDNWLYANYCQHAETHSNKLISVKRFSSLLLDLCVHQLYWKVAKLPRSSDGNFFIGLRIRTDADAHLLPSITGQPIDPDDPNPSNPINL